MKLVLSHTFLYKKFDAFGHQHNGKIVEMVKNESTRLLTVWNDVQSDESDLPNEADQGRKIVFDNFDFMQKVHHMSEAH